MKMALVDVKDSSEEAMYVPAWFIGYTETYKTGISESELVLNAVDGGRVLRVPIDTDPDMQQAMDAARKSSS